MESLIQLILDLFTDPAAAQAFMAGPQQAMYDNGLVNVSPDEFADAVANALPGQDFGADPMGGLQQVLADQYGYAPDYGGYGPDDGYGLDPVSTVVDDGAALVGDLGAGLLGAIDPGFGYGWPGYGYGWQPGFGGFGPGYGWGPGWGGPGTGTGFGHRWGEFRHGWGPGWGEARPGWGEARRPG